MNADEPSLPPDLHAYAMKYFADRVAEQNTGVTHAEFVAGLANGSMAFVCPYHRMSQLIVGTDKKRRFALYVALYVVVPLVLLPLLAWYDDNLWLLFGILISYIATFGTARIRGRERQYSVVGFLALVCLTAWILLGRYNYYTIFLTCALSGAMCLMIADDAEVMYARQSLVEDPEYFREKLELGHVMIVRLQ